MPLKFKLAEPTIGGYRPPKPFGLNSEGLSPHEILRLFLGSVDLIENSSGRILKISRNEFRKSSKRMCRPERVTKFLFDGAIDILEYEKFIKNISSSNVEFFARLKNEIVLMLACKKERRYTESFLHLYRILELVAVAFPLLYATTQSDFRHSHTFLKSLMNSERDGDLKVLTSAIPYIASQGDLAAVTFDFSVSGLSSNWVSEFRSQIRKCEIHTKNGFELDPENDIIFRVSFNHIPAILAAFRNRMFHYKAGEANLDLGYLEGSEIVSRPC